MSLTKYHYEQCPRCITNGKDSRGDNLVVYTNGHSHCFACGYHSFPRFFKPIERQDDAPKDRRPSDYTREVPSSAYVWLLQFGLPYSYWKEYTGYSEEAGKRLVFDVGSPLAFSIGRLLEPESKHSRKWFVWGDCHKHCEVLGDDHRSSRIVLVEDLVSAHKVGQVNTCIPLFGTKVYPAHLYYLINSNKPVVLWLDKDQELNVKKQALQLESIIDKPVSIVLTDKDPKSLTYEEINESLRC